MGRPKTVAADTRITIRLTATMRAELEELAKTMTQAGPRNEGVSMAEAMRYAVARGIEALREDAEAERRDAEHTARVLRDAAEWGLIDKPRE